MQLYRSPEQSQTGAGVGVGWAVTLLQVGHLELGHRGILDKLVKFFDLVLVGPSRFYFLRSSPEVFKPL